MKRGPLEVQSAECRVQNSASKRGRIILLAVVACGVVAGIAFAVRPREKEPEYQGRKLSEWLASAHDPSALDPVLRDQRAREAISAIGSNAVPCLIRWVGHSPSQARWLAAKLERTVVPGDLGTKVGEWILAPDRTRMRLGEEAVFGLVALGPGARAAVPDLIRLVTDFRNEYGQHRAQWVLRSLGTNSVPGLREALYDGRQANRYALVRVLGDLSISDPAWLEARGAVLVRCLADGDWDVRLAATNALRKIAPEVLEKMHEQKAETQKN